MSQPEKRPEKEEEQYESIKAIRGSPPAGTRDNHPKKNKQPGEKKTKKGTSVKTSTGTTSYGKNNK